MRISIGRVAALSLAVPAVVGGLSVPSEAATAPVQTVQASSCGGNIVTTPAQWSPGVGSCFIFGSKGRKVTFHWNVYGNQNTAFNVRGFDSKGKAYWHKCGTGGGNCVVPWGNVAAGVKVRGWTPGGAATIRFTY